MRVFGKQFVEGVHNLKMVFVHIRMLQLGAIREKSQCVRMNGPFA